MSLGLTEQDKLDTLVETMEELGLAFVAQNYYKAVEAVEKKKQNLSILAEYRVSGVPYSMEVEIDINAPDFGSNLNKLLAKVTEDIKNLEKTNLGIVSIAVQLSLKRGDCIYKIGTINPERQWHVLKDQFDIMKFGLSEKYANILKGDKK